MVRLPGATEQITGQIKAAPVRVLRAIFAGVGQLLLAADQLKAEEANVGTSDLAEHPDPLRPDPDGPRFRSLDATGNVRLLTPDDSAEPEPPQHAAASLPLAGYDGRSVASLRASLRNLDSGQLLVLIEYEKRNANREDVVTMFERRIAKLHADQA